MTTTEGRQGTIVHPQVSTDLHLEILSRVRPVRADSSHRGRCRLALSAKFVAMSGRAWLRMSWPLVRSPRCEHRLVIRSRVDRSVLYRRTRTADTLIVAVLRGGQHDQSTRLGASRLWRDRTLVGGEGLGRRMAGVSSQ